MYYYAQKIVKMSFLPLLSFTRKRESRDRNWIPCQARNDRQEYVYTKNKGFTLIELIITIVLLGIIAYIIAMAMSTGIKAFLVTDARKEGLDQTRIAMERMTREIRNIRSRGVDADADTFIDADIGTANASQFCFFDVNGIRISFRFAGSTITREENGAACPGAGGDILSANVTAMSFNYVLANGTITATPADPTDVRRVQINLQARVSNETVQLRSEIYLRNL